MGPYNHEAKNIFDACGIDEQSFRERAKENKVVEYFPIFNERELALMLSNDLSSMYNEDKTAIMCFARPHTKLKPFNLNRVKKNYDVDEIINNAQMLAEDVRINKFAAWHSWIVLSYALINRRSHAVQFIEENYSKSEIYVLLLFRNVQKTKALENVKEEGISAMIRTLMDIAKDTSPALAPILFSGDILDDNKYDILSIDDDFADRMIVQNDPTHRLLYSKANSVAQIYGVSHSSLLSLIEQTDNVKEFVNLVNNLELTDTEQAVLYSTAIDSLELEKMFCHVPVTMPTLISYFQHTDKKKRIWSDEIFAYDPIERVQWFLENNVTIEDVEHMIRIYNPEYDNI